MIDKHIRNHLKNFTVGIAGCGGLGSNCAVALARVGIGRLILADFDVVEASNLNRQYFFRAQLGEFKCHALMKNIGMIDEAVGVEVHVIMLTPENIPEIYRDCDVIVEAFDRADQKQMIIETVIEMMPDVPLVSGVGMAGWGMSDLIRMERYDKLYICGDQETEATESFPPLAPRVGIVANIQANTVMEILFEKTI